MSNIELKIEMPLDENRFFRRECPYCFREFKILINDDKMLYGITQKLLDLYLIEEDNEERKDSNSEQQINYFCPYCGQQAGPDHWWTQEQLAYVSIYAKNIMAQIINEKLIGQLKRTFSKSSSNFISFRFEGREIEQQEPWISPESNDMEIFDLPCCQHKMKIKEGWSGKIYCYLCGFPFGH